MKKLVFFYSFCFCFFWFEYLPPPEFQFREQELNYVSWRLAYENQVCIAKIAPKNVIVI